jgi:hypothetical protein
MSLMPSVIYAGCRKLAHYAECHYIEWRYAECRYAECRGAIYHGQARYQPTFVKDQKTLA